jgi:hypothetical protein
MISMESVKRRTKSVEFFNGLLFRNELSGFLPHIPVMQAADTG